MGNKIEDLRDHLFATLAALRNPDQPMDIDRAKAVAEVAKVIVDSAKVECEHMKLTGGDGSGFIPVEKAALEIPEAPGVPRLVRGRDMKR